MLFAANMEDCLHTLSIAEFADYLSTKFDQDVVDIMKNKISGATFLKLSERQLENIVPAVGDVIELRELQANGKVNCFAEEV